MDAIRFSRKHKQSASGMCRSKMWKIISRHDAHGQNTWHSLRVNWLAIYSFSFHSVTIRCYVCKGHNHNTSRADARRRHQVQGRYAFVTSVALTPIPSITIRFGEKSANRIEVNSIRCLWETSVYTEYIDLIKMDGRRRVRRIRLTGRDDKPNEIVSTNQSKSKTKNMQCSPESVEKHWWVPVRRHNRNGK